MSGYNPINFNYAGYTTQYGTFRFTPNVHINTPNGFGLLVNWDNGSTGDASVGQFAVGNGAGGTLFGVYRSGNAVHSGRLDVQNTARINLALGLNGYEPYGCGGYGLCLGGGAYSQSGWASGSDIRLKKDVTPITGALDKITKLEGVTFRWRDASKDPGSESGKHFGFIAQQVEPIIPEAVSTGPDSYKSLDYPSLSALLAEGIKDQQNQLTQIRNDFKDLKLTEDGNIETLDKRLDKHDADIESLKSEITQLKEEIKQLKAAVRQP
jgi:hypothetical protein